MADDFELLRGKVVGCFSERRGAGMPITLLTILSNGKTIRFDVHGQHRIDVGERVGVKFTTSHEVNIVSYYEIYNEDNKPKYSCEV